MGGVFILRGICLKCRACRCIIRGMNRFTNSLRNGDIFPWERDFTRETLNVAIPIVIQSMFTALMHIVDNVMIGQLGELELAAVTQANRITFLFQLVIFGLSGGTATLVAQFWGKRDNHGIQQTLGLSLGLSLLASLAFLAPCLLAPGPIMSLLLNDAAAVDIAASYLVVIVFSYVFTALAQCYATVQKSTEQAKLPMAANIVGLGVNTLLNYCLIFGRFGFPRMGARGGAVATVIAVAITLAITVIGGYRMHLATAVRLRALIPRSRAFASKFLSIAMPVIVNEGLWSLGMVMYSVVYGRMGTGVVAAVSIYNTVEQIALSGIRGLTSACAVLVGMRIGAGDEDAAYRAARRMLYAGIPLGLVSGLFLVLVSNPLLLLFNVTPKVAHDALMLIRLSASLMWLNQLGSMLIVGVMRSGGDVRMSLYLDAGTTWLIGVPMVALGGLALGLEIPYVFAMSYLESIVKIIFGLWRFRSRKWIHNLVR